MLKATCLINLISKNMKATIDYKIMTLNVIQVKWLNAPPPLVHKQELGFLNQIELFNQEEQGKLIRHSVIGILICFSCKDCIEISASGKSYKNCRITSYLNYRCNTNKSITDATSWASGIICDTIRAKNHLIIVC